MRSLLFRVKLFSTQVPVFEETSLLWDGRGGVYNQAEHTIVVNADLGADTKRIAFLHEFAHAASALGASSMDEPFSDRLACVLLSMIRGSQGLVPWLRKDSDRLPVVDVLGTDYETQVGEGYMSDRFFLRPGASHKAQALALLSAAIGRGFDALGSVTEPTDLAVASEACLALLVCPTKVLAWLGVPKA